VYENNVNHHMSEMWILQRGNNAYERLPVFLSMHEVRKRFETKTRRLLRLLQLRLKSMSAETD